MDVEVNDTLPSPTDTPYRTPTSSRSRQTSGTLEDMSPGTTPPPMPEALSTPLPGRKRSNDSITGGIDETLPLSDPRRFTPTLHASLVSEILSLRRDLENKTKDIDRLEQNFHSAHSQNETLNASILAANRETRQVKRQMQILEGGTLSAINEIGAERDNAVNEASELRSRLDQLQKKAKNSEQNLDRVQEQWQKDKESWHSEKRALETKVHIVEGRLKVVVSEVTKAHMNSHNEYAESPHRSQSRASMLESPNKRPASVAARRQSVTSTTSEQAGGRTSVMSFVGTGPNVNLADELALDDIEEHYDNQSEYDDGRTSPDALAEEHIRPTSSLSLKARKVLGLPIDLEGFDHSHRHSLVEPLGSNASTSGALRSIRKPTNYTDSSAQYSLPPSPTKEQRDLETPVPRDLETPAPRDFSPRELSPFDSARFSKALTSRSSASAAFSIDTSDNAWEELLANMPIMVSSSCQTVEQFPLPQSAPKKEGPLPTIVESTETREIAVQTDGQESFEPSVQVAHRRNDTVETVKSSASVATTDLQVPMIAIIPPTSRPVTPEDTSVQLPPRTKNQGCQVDASALVKYTSTAMQTEDIRVDRRALIPHPTFPPPPPPALLTGPTHAISTKAKSVPYLRRGVPNTANSSMRRTNPSLGLSPINDDGPVSDNIWPDISRPVRSSSMFAGFDEADENDDLFEDDVFHDDDMFSRPTAKFVLQRGKMSQRAAVDNDESEAALAGKRFALENIRRQSEDGIPPEIKELMPGYESGSEARVPKRSTKATTKPGPSKSSNMRRTAMISSGAAAHQSRHSQSSMGSGESSRPPPMPIPVRYSSARIGKSISDGGRSSRGSSNTSPTRNVRRVMKSSLRKTRSGPALSPAGVAAKRARSRSPPLADARVSIVPEMPQFYMPDDADSMRSAMPPNFATNYEASAPRPVIGQGPRRQTSHIKNNSDAVVPGQTSVVDAIAQTMVGEWMFKYVRRRKSFGKPDKDWDPNKSVEEMSNSASTGVRHKRWVWLAPYERSIMWSSKQPTDGTSLLGKSGRKLTIKSVLDVKDDNPMPKGAVIGTHFNRSILVLTPQRALKFTATTQDRHYIWLTALSFLSHSPITLSDLAPIPPLPQEDAQTIHSTSPAASLGGSFRRRPIRDSIRIAKNSNARSQFRSFTTDGQVVRNEYDRPPTEEAYDPVNDAALPPIIKRYHNRNRSNTAPRAPPSSFRNLLSRDSGPSTNASSAAVNYDQPSTAAGKQSSSGNPSAPSTRRSSEASAMGRPPLPNLQFLESTSNSSHAASMTMKIDAFMANAPPVGGRAPGRNMRFGLGGNGLRHQPSIRKDLGHWASDPMDQNNGGLGEPYTPTEFRFSESTGRGSSENGYFRAF